MPGPLRKYFLEFHQIKYLGLERPIFNWEKSLNYRIQGLHMFSLKDLFKYFFEVLDTTKSDRAAITLRYPRGGSRGRKPPAGSWADPQRTHQCIHLVIL